MSENSESMMIEKVATEIFDVPDIYLKWTEAEALARAAIEAMRALAVGTDQDEVHGGVCQ